MRLVVTGGTHATTTSLELFLSSKSTSTLLLSGFYLASWGFRRCIQDRERDLPGNVKPKSLPVERARIDVDNTSFLSRAVPTFF